MVKLSKIFSREKGIWYAYLWDESDRLGFKKYLNHEVENSLFIREGEKLSVWYDAEETETIHRKIREEFLRNKNFADELFKNLDHEWEYLGPYIAQKKAIKDNGELQDYYEHLVRWWSSMNILFRLELPENMDNSALKYREEAEKYSDVMIDVWDDFWIKKEEALRKIMNLATPEEAFATDNLSQKKIVSIMARQNGVALLNSVLYSLDQLRNAMKENKLELEEEATENITEFNGSTAFEGAVRGYVKIILLHKDISRIKEGEILVTDMTSPDYLPAIKKAVALITDEGGITCHAAIVARELKKPCIIGTKIATKVLKDGDLVEVDADKGLVRIIDQNDKTKK